MRIDTLEILRCPYCGGRLDLVESLFHRRTADAIHDGILGCHCCIFPVVDGIPVMHLQPAATAARDLVQAGKPELARRKMIGLESDAEAAAFEAAASSPDATFRETVEALGPNFEGGYFLYRFSDPTFIVAEAVVRSVAGTVLAGGGRAIDICGGSGHLTRALVDVQSGGPSPAVQSKVTPPPVLADLYFAKIWLARRFTAPGCEPVCCDGNAPFPFTKDAFGFAMCTDAFMYIWTKRQFVGEMSRLIHPDGAVLIGHTHNERTWTPSHGQPLSPEGYADLFEWIQPRIFAEGNLFEDTVAGGPLDLSRRDGKATLDAAPALTIVATRHPGVFATHAIARRPVSGELQVNPLYSQEPLDGGRVRLRLRFPDDEYEQEYGACRRYLPDEETLDRAALDALPALSARAAREPLPPSIAELLRRRVLLDLPLRYY